MSFWSKRASSIELICLYMALSSAKSLIFEVTFCSMSFIYIRNRRGPSTVPCGTPDATSCAIV